jgi:hypothetical protein
MAKKPQKGKTKAGKKSSGPPRSAKEVRLSEHPRARSQIRQVKSWAGLAGFGLAGYAAWKSGAPFVDAALRALLWGVIAYFAMWAAAVQVWRHLAVAEVRAVERRWREQQEEQRRVARERAEAAEAARREAEMAANAP